MNAGENLERVRGHCLFLQRNHPRRKRVAPTEARSVSDVGQNSERSRLLNDARRPGSFARAALAAANSDLSPSGLLHLGVFRPRLSLSPSHHTLRAHLLVRSTLDSSSAALRPLCKISSSLSRSRPTTPLHQTMATPNPALADIADSSANPTPSYASSTTAPVVPIISTGSAPDGKSEQGDAPKVYASEEERERAERESKYLTGSTSLFLCPFSGPFCRPFAGHESAFGSRCPCKSSLRVRPPHDFPPCVCSCIAVVTHS